MESSRDIARRIGTGRRFPNLPYPGMWEAVVPGWVAGWAAIWVASALVGMIGGIGGNVVLPVAILAGATYAGWCGERARYPSGSVGDVTVLVIEVVTGLLTARGVLYAIDAGVGAVRGRRHGG